MCRELRASQSVHPSAHALGEKLVSLSDTAGTFNVSCAHFHTHTHTHTHAHAHAHAHTLTLTLTLTLTRTHTHPHTTHTTPHNAQSTTDRDLETKK